MNNNNALRIIRKRCMPSYYHWHTTIIVHLLGPKGPPFLGMNIFRVYTRLIKSKSHRHSIICCHHLQIPPSSAAPSAASSAIFQASYYTGILSPFVAYIPCQGPIVHPWFDSQTYRQRDRGICNRRSAVTRQMPSSVTRGQGQLLDAQIDVIGQECWSNPMCVKQTSNIPKFGRA